MALWEPDNGAPLDVISNACASVFRAKFFMASQFASAVVGRMQNLCTFCLEKHPDLAEPLHYLLITLVKETSQKTASGIVARALLTLLCNESQIPIDAEEVLKNAKG